MICLVHNRYRHECELYCRLQQTFPRARQNLSTQKTQERKRRSSAVDLSGKRVSSIFLHEKWAVFTASLCRDVVSFTLSVKKWQSQSSGQWLSMLFLCYWRVSQTVSLCGVFLYSCIRCEASCCLYVVFDTLRCFREHLLCWTSVESMHTHRFKV